MTKTAPSILRPYRDKTAFNFAKRDTKTLKEESYRGLETQPLIEQITVKLDGIGTDAQDGYLIATGQLQATYKNNKAALPKIDLKITGGSKELGLTKANTSNLVRRIEGYGYHDQPLPSSEGEGPKQKYARSGVASMHYAVFFHGGEAIHVGPLNRSSHGCIHIGDNDAGFAIAQQINYHSAVGKTKVEVAYTGNILKILKAQRR
ncbi:MAG: L,D-transpeptidase [Caldilineaceae bacterium]